MFFCLFVLPPAGLASRSLSILDGVSPYVPVFSRAHPELLFRPAVAVFTVSEKISERLPTTLHYYSLPVAPVTIHDPLDTSAKTHSVKINSVYRLGAHEMEIATPNT